MTTIPVALRRLVIARADNRCEYCGIPQTGQVATFHIDHIAPVVADGKTTAENLALTCVSCSLRKGAQSALGLDRSAYLLYFTSRSEREEIINHFPTLFHIYFTQT